MNRLYILLITSFLNLTAFAQIDTTEQVYQIVEEMPTLKSCNIIDDYSERRACSDKKLLEYVYRNFKTPNIEESLIIDCRVHLVSFIVEKDGSISNIEIIRSCEAFETALKTLLSNLPEFEAGRQRGVPVRVKYQFPMRISFR